MPAEDSGVGNSSLSADGHLVAFSSSSVLVSGDTNGVVDVFVHDMQTGETTRVSVPDSAPPSNDLTDYFSSQTNRLLQTSAPWGTTAYGGGWYQPAGGTAVFLPFISVGSGKDTVGYWGCALTSTAMILNYFAQKQSIVFQTNPGELNTWLQNNDGYKTGTALPKNNPDYFDSSFVKWGSASDYVYSTAQVQSRPQAITYRDKDHPTETIEQFMN